MSESPIFDRLVGEFALRESKFEDFAYFKTPEFVWDPSAVVQLDRHEPKGVKLKKPQTAVQAYQSALEAAGFTIHQVKEPGVVDPFPGETREPLMARSLPAMVHRDVLKGHEIVSMEEELLMEKIDFAQAQEEYMRLVNREREKFFAEHPNAIVTGTKFEENSEGGLTMVIEAVEPRPTTPVVPLSERNTAQPME